VQVQVLSPALPRGARVSVQYAALALPISGRRFPPTFRHGHLDPEHEEDGAAFDWFGLVKTEIVGNARRVYFDDLTDTCGP
jgi:hypothetical protein